MLATKEVDYFVYLGYNATDGVVIGFSRIPYVTQYDQFSATTTNEKYCAISTISNAAAGDDYTVVGRFAATLSAGAGYTWTVPTFTTINLIQRPILQTRSLTWLPTYTGSGSMTYTSVTTYAARYRIIGYHCEVQHTSTGTVGGTPAASIRVSLPISAVDKYVLNGGGFAFTNGVSQTGGCGSVNGDNTLLEFYISAVAGTNWTAGAIWVGANVSYPLV
jgi:hypothetical protein